MALQRTPATSSTTINNPLMTTSPVEPQPVEGGFTPTTSAPIDPKAVHFDGSGNVVIPNGKTLSSSSVVVKGSSDSTLTADDSGLQCDTGGNFAGNLTAIDGSVIGNDFMIGIVTVLDSQMANIPAPSAAANDHAALLLLLAALKAVKIMAADPA